MGTSFYPGGLNNAGQVVGSNSGNLGSHVLLYSGGGLQDLGTVGGYPSGWATGINDSGLIVGNCEGSDSLIHGFFYSGGKMQVLPPGASGRQSGANAVNNAGLIAGGSEVAYDHVISIFHAYAYTATDLHDLGTLGLTADSSVAYAVNDLGQFVGGSTRSGGSSQHAALFSDGQVQDLGTLSGDYISSARGINNAGQIVGWSESSAGKYHAFLYGGGQMQYLGALPGCTNSGAAGINDAGQIVGWCSGTNYGSSSRQAFLYSSGQMLDLGALMGFPHANALAINNVGQIVGCAYDANGQEHGFLLTPTPEPATLSMLVLGGLAMLRRRRGRTG